MTRQEREHIVAQELHTALLESATKGLLPYGAEVKPIVSSFQIHHRGQDYVVTVRAVD